MTEKRFYMDKSGDLYDKENGLLMLDFGYSYDGVNCKRLIDLLNALHEENIQLKKENMEYYHLINCGNCKYHNYDWFDDGDEFEVCDKGNNERLIYNKFCKDWVKL